MHCATLEQVWQLPHQVLLSEPSSAFKVDVQRNSVFSEQ